eukprot:6570352-Pyramimonas_sp.AAC.1
MYETLIVNIPLRCMYTASRSTHASASEDQSRGSHIIGLATPLPTTNVLRLTVIQLWRGVPTRIEDTFFTHYCLVGSSTAPASPRPTGRTRSLRAQPGPSDFDERLVYRGATRNRRETVVLWGERWRTSLLPRTLLARLPGSQRHPRKWAWDPPRPGMASHRYARRGGWRHRGSPLPPTAPPPESAALAPPAPPPAPTKPRRNT